MMTCKVVYSRITEEFCVQVRIDGKRYSAADYFTICPADAHQTAKAMVKQHELRTLQRNAANIEAYSANV